MENNKLSFVAKLKIIGIILLVFIGIFIVSCGGTFLGFISFLGPFKYIKDTVIQGYILLIPIISLGLGLIYLIIKYGVKGIKKIKNNSNQK